MNSKLKSPKVAVYGLLGLLAFWVVGFLVEYQSPSHIDTEEALREQQAAAERKVLKQKDKEENQAKSQAVLESLKSMGLVHRVKHESNTVYVDPGAWAGMTYDAKEAAAQVLARYCELNCDEDNPVVFIHDMYSGERLARQNPWIGFKTE
jgi:hypothetical protein